MVCCYVAFVDVCFVDWFVLMLVLICCFAKFTCLGFGGFVMGCLIVCCLDWLLSGYLLLLM